MSRYAGLKQTIDDNIRQNEDGEITGSVLNTVLNEMTTALGKGYQYMGLAVPATNPGTPDQQLFYMALEPGTYTHFGSFVLESGKIGLFVYDTIWHETAISLGADIAEYLKSATVSADGKTLTLTKKDGTTVAFTPAGSSVEIVNDLTTGGANKALSAEQGKVLKEMIEGGAIPVIYNAMSNTLALAILEIPDADISLYTHVSYTDTNGNNHLYKYAGLYVDAFDYRQENSWIDTEHEDDYIIDYFTMRPDARTFEQDVRLKSDGGTEVQNGWQTTDYIPVDRYFQFGTSWAGRCATYDSNKQLVAYTSYTYGKKLLTPSSDVAYIRLSFTNGNINYQLGYKAGTSTASFKRSHVFVRRKYDSLIDYNDVDFPENLTGYVPIDGYDIIVSLKGSFAAVNFYDGDKTLLKTQTINDKVTAPSNARYVRIGSSTLNPTLMYTEDRMVSRFGVAVKKPHKNWLVFGDSISAATSIYATKPYSSALGEKYNIGITNKAVSGDSSLDIIGNQHGLLIDYAKYDVVTIYIGANDWGYNHVLQDVIDNINTLVEHIISVKPTIKIGIASLMHRSDMNEAQDNVAGYNMQELSDAIKAYANGKGIQVIDLRRDCQCNFLNSIYKAQFSTYDGGTTGNGCHPTNEAHRLFVAPLFEDFLKRNNII